MTLKFFILFALSAGECFVLTWVVLRFAKLNEWYDDPGERKIHTVKTPRLGGIAIVASFFLSIFVGYLFFKDRFSIPRNILLLYLPVMIIVFLGIFDDLKGANAVQKFFFQIICGIIVYHLSFSIRYLSLPFIGSVKLGILSPVATVLWVVFVINAFNLIDGLDGLLARIALYASLCLGIIFYMRNERELMMFALILVGALLGFLPWNLHPAKIFLGDTGSMFLGFLFAVFSMATSQKNPLSMSLIVPVIIILIPLVDTSWAFVRRVKKRQSPFKADQSHVHHYLLSLFGSHKKASFVLSSLSGLFSGIGIIASEINVRYRPILLIAALIICGFFIFRWKEKSKIQSIP